VQQYKAQTGQDLTFQESYLGSGAQSRAVVEGFEADVVALSLGADVDRIAKAGLITHDWQGQPHGGMVTDSVVVIGVRAGNPKGIKDWADLARSGVEVLTPDPKTSGGAQWNVMALYGAALRGQVPGVAKGDPEAAGKFLQSVFRNVSVLDKGARESLTNFEKGVGDAAITYENELVVAQKAGRDEIAVMPSSTILIENPIAVVDAYVDQHGTRAAAEAFRDFLLTPEAQRVFAEYGLRPVDEGVAKEVADRFPVVPDLFTIQEFGGWEQVTGPFFGPDGVYTRLIEALHSGS
jgi:sulfate transport system substrate-binding protein